MDLGNNFGGAFLERGNAEENGPAVLQEPAAPEPAAPEPAAPEPAAPEPAAPEPPADNERNNIPPLNEREIALEEGGVIEAGVAHPHYSSSSANNDTRRSTECDMVLFFQCHENLQSHPDCIAKHGITISIGLEKPTKLNAVFAHFARFCSNSNNHKETIRESELEFVHNEVLSGNETAEGSALMKNDVIKVRRLRVREKEMNAEKKKIQMQSDHHYFKDFRNLMFSRTDKSFDVVLDCGNQLKTNTGRGSVKAHSVIISKRSPWLKMKIRDAMVKPKMPPVIRIPNDIFPILDGGKGSKRKITVEGSEGTFIEEKLPSECYSQNSKRTRIDREGKAPYAHMSEAIDNDTADELPPEDDSDDSVQPCPLNEQQPLERNVDGGAAEVVAEEDDLPANIVRITNSRPILRIALEDYPVQAVKLLLEYCYTNRCIPLGREAFYQLSKGTVVDPFNAKWPKQGQPTISMSIALAGISLADEAGLPRLSHMCEIAATNLLHEGNVVDALCVCTVQSSRKGNSLPLLRKNAMMHFLQRPKLEELTSGASLWEAFEKKSHLAIPSMLIGTQEVLTEHGFRVAKGRNSYWMFPQHDKADREARNRERQKYVSEFHIDI